MHTRWEKITKDGKKRDAKSFTKLRKSVAAASQKEVVDSLDECAAVAFPVTTQQNINHRRDEIGVDQNEDRD